MLNPILYSGRALSDLLRYQLTRCGIAERDLYAQMRLLDLEETRHSPLLNGPYTWRAIRPFSWEERISAP